MTAPFIRTLATTAAIVLGASTAHAQGATRVDLSGPFVHFGGIIGSVSRQSGPIGDSHTGAGYGAGGGIGFTRAIAVVGSYTIFNFTDTNAPSPGTMEQTEAGLRLRVGGVRTPAIFYLEGGGAMRSTELTSSRVFGDEVPSGVGEVVSVKGWAGWFGPGTQVYFGRRLAADISIAWAWGEMEKAVISGNTTPLTDPVALTTLRLRLGLAAVIF